MKVQDLKKALEWLDDYTEITISVDVSTGDDDASRRAFATELLGFDIETKTLLTAGALNDKPRKAEK